MYRLQEIVDRLLREKTPRSLLDSMHKVLREVGVEHLALMRFAHTGEPLDKWVIGYRAPPQWIEAYRHRDDPNADPIVKHSRETVEPFFWSDVIDDEGARKARGMHVPEGLVIPVPGPYGCVGTMWMGGRTRGLNVTIYTSPMMRPSCSNCSISFLRFRKNRRLKAASHFSQPSSSSRPPFSSR